MSDIFKGLGVEVTFKRREDFLRIKETLTRIGVASKQENKLFQSCHILHKKGRYAIVHFKEMFALDGKETDISEDDIARRNKIALLLSDWKLLELVDPDKISDIAQMSGIKVIPYKDKQDWQLVSKYTIGKKRIDDV
jgi:hypothetical protein